MLGIQIEFNRERGRVPLDECCLSDFRCFDTVDVFVSENLYSSCLMRI